MRLLLDTCALLALSGQAGRLSRSASRALTAPESVFVSPVTAWEIAIKAKSGKLRLATTADDWFRLTLERYHLFEAPFRTGLLCAAADLPLIHRDPFDRVLVATCLSENLTILTSDKVIPVYPGVHAIW